MTRGWCTGTCGRKTPCCVRPPTRYGLIFRWPCPGARRARPWGPGTRAYASPEQRAGRSADPRDDIYSFGLLLLQLLSGELPGATVALAADLLNAEDGPPALTTWLRAALAPARAARPADLGEIAGILRAD